MEPVGLISNGATRGNLDPSSGHTGAAFDLRRRLGDGYAYITQTRPIFWTIVQVRPMVVSVSQNIRDVDGVVHFHEPMPSVPGWIRIGVRCERALLPANARSTDDSVTCVPCLARALADDDR